MENLKIAVLMDPPETINIDKDTTFALALEAQSRGYSISIIFMDDLMLKDTLPCAFTRRVEFKRSDPCYRWLNEPQLNSLEEFDYLLVRKDPPFDEKYFFATHFLSLLKKTKVVNRPDSLRNAPEKIYALNFPEINPPTLITSGKDEIKKFMLEVGGEIIVKPLNRCGGSGIIYLHAQDKNFNSLIEMSTNEGDEYVIVQQYLPEIEKGDKRVICIDGVAEGAILRVPDQSDHRGNIHVGGTVIYAELTSRDRWLISKIKDRLMADKLYFVGLDIIGDYITEINVTSPTGIQEIKNLGGKDLAKIFWDRLPNF